MDQGWPDEGAAIGCMVQRTGMDQGLPDEGAAIGCMGLFGV